MNESMVRFYSRLYRCEDCRGIQDPRGVFYFVNGRGVPKSAGYLPPTIPVSHFGDVVNSRLWIVTTNPKGDRDDALVGLNVMRFDATRRRDVKGSDVNAIFNAQCSYFREGNDWHSFFLDFVDLLDGIDLGGHALSFGSGDVCFVDAIKCPTAVAWGSFVRSDEGKEVWNNCLRIGNRFLPRQIELHKPRAVLYYGTGQLVKVAQKGAKVDESPTFSNNLKLQTRHLYSHGQLQRVSVEFSKARLNLSRVELNDIQGYVASALKVLRL